MERYRHHWNLFLISRLEHKICFTVWKNRVLHVSLKNYTYKYNKMETLESTISDVIEEWGRGSNKPLYYICFQPPSSKRAGWFKYLLKGLVPLFGTNDKVRNF